MEFEDLLIELNNFINNTDYHGEIYINAVTEILNIHPNKRNEMIEFLTRNLSFYDVLCIYIDRAGITEPTFYHNAEITAAVFNNIRNPGYTPSKKTVFKSIIGLQLDFLEASMLLEIAGYSFVFQNKLDLVIAFCLIRHVYDKIIIDSLLNEVNTNTLFS